MNRSIFRKVAKKHGVSVETVRQDMQAAIDHAYSIPDNQAMAMAFGKTKPTLDEFLEHAKMKIKDDIE